jgi:hypothetical protein
MASVLLKNSTVVQRKHVTDKKFGSSFYHTFSAARRVALKNMTDKNHNLFRRDRWLKWPLPLHR